MTLEQQERLKQLLINNRWMARETDIDIDDPLTQIWFSDLIDLLEDYKAGRI